MEPPLAAPVGDPAAHDHGERADDCRNRQQPGYALVAPAASRLQDRRSPQAQAVAGDDPEEEEDAEVEYALIAQRLRDGEVLAASFERVLLRHARHQPFALS